MARLNEPPAAVPQPSADNIEVVKRRFLRQNRELAKTNSQQSMRIRTLESDCSRLLAENLALRERAMHLQHTVDKQANALSFESIDVVRSQLEAKMQELGSLVASLGQPKQAERRRKSQHLARHRPQERNFKSGLYIQEVENRLLPTIDEGNDHPRRTMNSDEIRMMLEDPETQSPDIGPPPTSSFEAEEPIAFDLNPSSDRHTDEVATQDEPVEDEPVLPMNLETRKKRRESGPKLNIRRISVFESPEEVKEKPGKLMRTGAKRKFSVQEDEERPETHEEEVISSHEAVQEAGNDDDSDKPQSLSLPRSALSNRSVNTDPLVSPKKQRSSMKDQEKPQKKKLPSVNPRGRPRLPITRTITPPEIPMLAAPEPVLVAEINLDSLPPKTPAADAIFSPPPTEPSTSRPGNRDTPPPGDVSSGNQTGQAGRPSRRARPQVSYKEPSLAAKMRRDGKLADAVVPQTDRRTSVEMTLAPLTTGRVALKRETGDEEAEAGSPLRQKLDRRDNAPQLDSAQAHPSATSKAISALIDQTSVVNRRASSNFTAKTSDEPSSEPVDEKESAVEAEAVEKDNLAIFDFNESSPVHSKRLSTDLAKVVRNSRRHSAVPALALGESEKVGGSLPLLDKRMGSGTIKSTSTTSLAKSTSAARLIAKKTAAPTSLDTKTDDSAAGDAGKATATSALRAERMASRRKSMML
ncbi:shugoshin [Boeremia exigua]|uniref:shugoshin n=1 Tax=Boeremia exigua TaxID=749465 RepID=UPI001E8E5488|nr:shugoshin [Boeremia exigua]KAH6639627.1 shugoshin [Boeremia exigua]